MTTQFLSRVERDPKLSPYVDVGPGSYERGPGGINVGLPGFAPFASSSKRMPHMRDSHSPSPGQYNTSEDMTKKTGVTSGFKSASRRFEDKVKPEDPGPGSYEAKSTLVRPLPAYPKPSRSEVLPARSRSPPSIPARSQSHGYEVTTTGEIKPQPPALPGYSGEGVDRVGPADYNPKVDLRFRAAPKAVFPKAPERTELEKTLSKNANMPGPGYYNSPASSFAVNDEQEGQDFLIHLLAAKKRQLSVFESKTARDGIQQEVNRKKDLPGPGQYDLLPSTASSSGKAIASASASSAKGMQSFGSTQPRFQEDLARVQLHTAPDSLQVNVSDFDRSRLQILRQQRLTQRADWVRSVGFSSRSERFRSTGSQAELEEVPPPTHYRPRVGLADQLPRANPRSGPFGSRASRFQQNSTDRPATLSPTRQKEAELNRDIARYLAQHPAQSRNGPSSGYGNMLEGSHSPSSSSSPRKPLFTSAFAPSAQDRLRPVRTPPGPPPGAYDVRPGWLKAKGVLSMIPKAAISRKAPERPTPGPGQYNGLSPLGQQVRINRKNIMVGTAPRELRLGHEQSLALPGPGDYDPSPVQGSLIKPSFNILLSEKY